MQDLAFARRAAMLGTAAATLAAASPFPCKAFGRASSAFKATEQLSNAGRTSGAEKGLLRGGRSRHIARGLAHRRAALFPFWFKGRCE